MTNPSDPAGKTAIVTGSSRGIGKAIFVADSGATLTLGGI